MSRQLTPLHAHQNRSEPGAADRKSSNSAIVNNTFRRLDRPDLEITSLKGWFEGPTLIENVTIADNSFYEGAGKDIINWNHSKGSGVDVSAPDNRFLPDETVVPL